MLIVHIPPVVTGPCRFISLVGGGQAIVDPDDYEKIKHLCWRKKKSSSGFYAVTRAQRRGKVHTVFMHRLIMKTPAWMKTHHVNHNRLDNRKSNLMILTERMHRHFDGWHYFTAEKVGTPAIKYNRSRKKQLN